MARTLVTNTNNLNTVRTSSLDALTADIRRYAVLNADDEIEKFNAYIVATGAEKERIKSEIACANLRFVLSVAKKFSADGDTICGLVSAGTIGLYRAIETFDPSRGFKFISQAVHWIRAFMSEFFKENVLVRRTNNAIIGSKDKIIAERFLQREMREPTEDEIIEALEQEYGIKVLNRVDICTVRASSIDETVSSDDDAATVGEIGEIALATSSRNGFEREMEKEDAKAQVDKLLAGLSFRERDIICRRFGIGYDREYEIDEIAEEIGYTAERVRQILKNAMPRLKARQKALARLTV